MLEKQENSGRPTSTCSFDQLSMLNDFTLDMCVPSFRCMVAHRMHKKMPNYSTFAR